MNVQYLKIIIINIKKARLWMFYDIYTEVLLLLFLLTSLRHFVMINRSRLHTTRQ